TRSSAITATAPASSAILACSGVTTSMITPPLSMSAIPRLTRAVPVWAGWVPVVRTGPGAAGVLLPTAVLAVRAGGAGTFHGKLPLALLAAVLWRVGPGQEANPARFGRVVGLGGLAPGAGRRWLHTITSTCRGRGRPARRGRPAMRGPACRCPRGAFPADSR